MRRTGDEDRRGTTPARERDRDHVGELLRHRVALEEAPDARDDEEDRRDRGERELEAGIEQGVRVPGEQDQRPDEQEVPAVALPRGEPRERAERARDPRPDHGRLRADGEHVRADPGERAELAEPARQAEHPREAEHAERDEHDVRAAHREQVVEPGGPEGSWRPARGRRPRRARSLRGPRGALPRARARARARATRAPGRRSRRSRPAADDPPVVGLRRRRGRRGGGARFARRSRARPARHFSRTSSSRLRALRRRATDRELEQHRLAGAQRPKRVSVPARASRTARPRRPGDDGARARSPDVRREHARSSASSRSLPHHQPPSTSASASRTILARGSAVNTPDRRPDGKTRPRAPAPTTFAARARRSRARERVRVAAEQPSQAPPARAAGRRGPGRFPGSRPGR